MGKILFKWDRSTDVDMDSLLNEYYIPSLYYRLELVETGEYTDENDNGVTNLVAAEVITGKTSIFASISKRINSRLL